MAKTTSNNKRILISKANSSVVIASGIAAFIFVFCAIASKTLFSQMQYQNRVISKEKSVLTQVKADLKAANSLNDAYTAFNATTQNVIDGNPQGDGPQDGNNAKVILDALPTTSDNLAVTTSMYKLLTIDGVTITSISNASAAGTAAPAATTTATATTGTAAPTSTGSANPQPIPIPLTITATGNYASLQKLIDRIQHSIRPIQVQTMSLSGSESSMTLSLTAQTFYQPAKTLNVTKEIVK